MDAGRLLGRLTGVSALRHLEVFVLESDRLHVSVPPSASRLPVLARTHRIHRRLLLRTPHPDALIVEPLDAVYDAVMSQSPRAAVATIDSALHLGVLHPDDLDELFAALPRRYRRLRRLLDRRAESGPETLVRLMLRSLGCNFDCQVMIVGVGRVDFLVDGWLIVECDSRAHHSSWEAQRTDRRRDLEAATRGYPTLRLIAEDILWRPGEVRAALEGVLAGRSAFRKQGQVRLRSSMPRTVVT
ncbi:MAG: DUF559 domain-containing protein [Protaetiibacter sp.]